MMVRRRPIKLKLLTLYHHHHTCVEAFLTRKLPESILNDMDIDNQPEASTSARQLPLPSTPFYVVEYPGRVKPSSVPEAVRTLGGLSSLENAFKRGATKAETLVELHLRPDNPFAHPIPGSVVSSTTLLMKVVKRKKKNRNPDDPVVGHYTTQMMGVVPKTVRFRSASLVDYVFASERELTAV